MQISWTSKDQAELIIWELMTKRHKGPRLSRVELLPKLRESRE